MAPTNEAEMDRKGERQVVQLSELMKPGAMLDRLLEHMTAHARELSEIAMRGDVAVVVFEPDEAFGSVRGALDAMGARGRSVFGITRTRMREIATKCDHVTEAWAKRPSGTQRLAIFVFIHRGTLLVNYEPGVEAGFSLEPGQLDAELFN